MNKPTQACWWIVGFTNAEQPPAVAIDLHDENGNLIRPHGFDEPMLIEVASVDYAEEAAIIYAAENGIGALDVHFDEDSTQFFADA